MQCRSVDNVSLMAYLCQMLDVDPWTLVHADQLLFACVGSKVIVCHAVLSFDTFVSVNTAILAGC